MCDACLICIVNLTVFRITEKACLDIYVRNNLERFNWHEKIIAQCEWNYIISWGPKLNIKWIGDKEDEDRGETLVTYIDSILKEFFSVIKQKITWWNHDHFYVFQFKNHLNIQPPLMYHFWINCYKYSRLPYLLKRHYISILIYSTE